MTGTAITPPLLARDNRLWVEGVSLASLAAEYGTPLYVYSASRLAQNFRAYRRAFAALDPLLCYAVKANSNLALLSRLAQLGAGFDIVSGGELLRVLRAGGEPGKTVFSGVGKRREEMEAALDADILCFNVESAAELQLLSTVCKAGGKVARVSFRVNPDVDAGTHPNITTGRHSNKFGMSGAAALAAYRLAMDDPCLEVTGINCHIGSQITRLEPVLKAAEHLLQLVATLAREGVRLQHVNLGGGLGVRYRDETPPSPAQLAEALQELMQGGEQRLLLEPGRSLVADAGVLLTRVLYHKKQQAEHFTIVDAAMNDLGRPALYEAWHPILNVRTDVAGARKTNVVGPICESTDCLAKRRPLASRPGDLLAIGVAGAYAMSMSSNYNSRPRAAEVLIEGGGHRLIRARESIETQLALELPSAGCALHPEAGRKSA